MHRLDIGLSGLQSRSTPFEEERNLLPLLEIESSSLVTVTITLSQIVTACVMQKRNKSDLTVNSIFPITD